LGFFHSSAAGWACVAPASRRRAFAAGVLAGHEDARLDVAIGAALDAYSELIPCEIVAGKRLGAALAAT